nr:zinc finger, CCHC-type, retrotransposon Gag domain protein [Tanacetum cinerariifolium]
VGAAAGDAQRQARHFKWGLKKWVLDQVVNTDYTNVAQVAAAARNIELLHESENSNKRDRDGVVRIEVMIRNDRIFRVRIKGLLVGMGMTARVKVTTTSASTGISRLGILTRVMLQVLQVRGGLLRLYL